MIPLLAGLFAFLVIYIATGSVVIALLLALVFALGLMLIPGGRLRR